MKLTSLVLTCFAVLLLTSFQPKPGWNNLLDKNLSQWGMYLGYSLDTNYNGQIPKDANGNNIPPVGYNKNERNVFSVAQENGEPVLRISGEIYGCVFTKQEYENFDLKLKVRWGTKKYSPRKNRLKDSGICYFSQGEGGKDYWHAWMLSQEFQLMEGHMGDYWNIANAAIDVRALLPEGTMNPVASHKQPFLSMGAGTALPGFCLRTADYENPQGEWTNVELICYQGKSLHIVNGHVVMVLANSRYNEGGQNHSLTKGKIQLQSEACEVYYKDIQIKNLTSLAPEYAALFK